MIASLLLVCGLLALTLVARIWWTDHRKHTWDHHCHTALALLDPLGPDDDPQAMARITQRAQRISSSSWRCLVCDMPIIDPAEHARLYHRWIP